MNRRETERLLAAIRGAQRAGKRAALATVVRVRGSAYRREGTRIVVLEDGSYECLLSGGCLEPAVAEAAARVIETGTPIIAQYDLEADSVWSLGIGCSGAVDIHIERLENDPITLAWLGVLERAEAAVLVKSLTGLEGRLLVHEREILGTLGQAALDAEAIACARARLDAAFPQSGPDRIGQMDLFLEVSTPPPELVIFGAGFDAEPLARQGWELGLAVTVVDVREAFLSADRFPHATLVSAHFSRFAEAVRLTERSFVVVMNHHLERDRESMRFALGSPAPYIGVLGPRSRFDKLGGWLQADGVVLNAAALSRVRSPVGLAIGADTPEEIAVSILGEIIALQRGFDGGFLAGRVASLHRASAPSSTTSALARS
jgi:xanthine dehydrogenase accessory factor